ncbi:hypothetical protein LX32DRAFT_91358 [Colletotrichum zoysiae]|uniref:Uncharacterized protein n=1 Tax=Colletotrichum zoysiae TaxID=1216348 RepID=A0AAD9HB41_9PEZI|nr:hypothetical protein LX32DRAFT_91358 [Colletotrichum zoysiae]
MAPNTSESRVAVHHGCHRPFVWNPVRPGNEVGGEGRASVLAVEAQQRIKKVLLKLLVCHCVVGWNQERHNAFSSFFFLLCTLQNLDTSNTRTQSVYSLKGFWLPNTKAQGPRWEKRTQSSTTYHTCLATSDAKCHLSFRSLLFLPFFFFSFSSLKEASPSLLAL